MTDTEHPRLSEVCGQLDQFLRYDPVGRGTQRLCDARGGDGAHLLGSAALELARPAGAVAIVTGFYIAAADPPAAETDGIPGSLFLAGRLLALGHEVCLVTDVFGAPLLKVGCELLGLSGVEIQTMPLEGGDEWAARFWRSSTGNRLTHLISIERAGPSHTPESIRLLDDDPQTWDDFQREVPPADHDRCHNMAGFDITPFTAPAHRLFEQSRADGRSVSTIAIGDGGNEIGFGAVPWSRLRNAMAGCHGARSACRVPADQLLIAGISDWGAYALAAATCLAARREDLLHPDQVSQQRDVLEGIVRQASAVDGITAQRTATVDSLKMHDYLQGMSHIIAVIRP
jgi:hypothetical protein